VGAGNCWITFPTTIAPALLVSWDSSAREFLVICLL
jgi:hypothetical protein